MVEMSQKEKKTVKNKTKNTTKKLQTQYIATIHGQYFKKNIYIFEKN